MDLLAILLLIVIVCAIFGGFAYSPLLFILVAALLIVALFGYGRPRGRVR